jgi:hypothetical protein
MGMCWLLKWQNQSMFYSKPLWIADDRVVAMMEDILTLN